MSLLGIVQDAAVLVGLSRPAAVASSSDTTVQQMMLLASLAAEEVAKWHDWSGLSVPGSITGDGTTTTWTLPTDFDRFAQGQRIILDGGTGLVIAGPLRADEIATLRARTPVTVSYVFYRRGNQLVTAPALASGRHGIYEYQSKNWCTAASGVARDRFSSDDDTVAAFPEALVMLGLAWMWKQAKGLEYAAEYERWRSRVELEAARDRNMRPVASGPTSVQLPIPIIPDTIIIG